MCLPVMPDLPATFRIFKSNIVIFSNRPLRKRKVLFLFYVKDNLLYFKEMCSKLIVRS